MFELLKKGNKASLTAAIVNAIIAVIRGIAFAFTGNVAMFAETMHALGDAINQLFVYIGSAISKKKPTERFPNGFGRVVNLVCLGAVLIVGILSYETVKEGIHRILHPEHTEGFLIVAGVLALGVILESFVLFKAMKEVLHETGKEAKGFGIIKTSFRELSMASPATKLVFMEDMVATGGGLLALISVIIAHFTGWGQLEGIASAIIGIAMFVVVGKVFLENAAGAIGERGPRELEIEIGNLISSDSDVKDIKKMLLLKEGSDYHVEVSIELAGSLTLDKIDVIKQRIATLVIAIDGVVDVLIVVEKDNGIKEWIVEESRP